MKKIIATALGLVLSASLCGLAPVGAAQADGFGPMNMMNPGKWFGGNNRDDDYYGPVDGPYGPPPGYGYGYGAPPIGAPYGSGFGAAPYGAPAAPGYGQSAGYWPPTGAVAPAAPVRPTPPSKPEKPTRSETVNADKERIRELEDRIHRLEQERAATPPESVGMYVPPVDGMAGMESAPVWRPNN